MPDMTPGPVQQNGATRQIPDPEMHVGKGTLNIAVSRAQTETGKIIVQLRIWHIHGLSVYTMMADYATTIGAQLVEAGTGLALAREMPKGLANGKGS